ncbi:uncharacterized protein LOC124650607 isoform X2 [Lolium rigidum]|uniref:uncharacterized protein LOC124650607 isoform X2 n=1 Tax=Lolium rigidum TaxID=89674 RepID=UPI001F5E06B8|nr:uncharacterized protein LOC124650607 isoform X2 [Lolium rigidum]
MVFLFAELSLMQYYLVLSKPSMVAAAAVYTARLTPKNIPLWTDMLKHHTGFSESHYYCCLHGVVRPHRKTSSFHPSIASCRAMFRSKKLMRCLRLDGEPTWVSKKRRQTNEAEHGASARRQINETEHGPSALATSKVDEEIAGVGEDTADQGGARWLREGRHRIAGRRQASDCRMADHGAARWLPDGRRRSKEGNVRVRRDGNVRGG